MANIHESPAERESGMRKVGRLSRRIMQRAQWWRGFDYRSIWNDSRKGMDRCPSDPNHTKTTLLSCSVHATDTTGKARSWEDIDAKLSPSEKQAYFDDSVIPRFAEFNARIPLSPSVHESSGESVASSNEGGFDKVERVEDNKFRIALQRWNRYRYDYRARGVGFFVPSTTPTTPFPFGNLPAELRREILSLVLKRGKKVSHMPADCSTPREKSSGGNYPDNDLMPVLEVRLFAVSRAMKAEAEEVFFHDNTFAVNISEALPLFITQQAGGRSGDATSPWEMRAPRRFHIYAPFMRDRSGIASMFPQKGCLRSERNQRLQILAKVLLRCKRVDEVRFMLCDVFRSMLFNDDMDRDFEEMMWYFGAVRRVGNVAFELPSELLLFKNGIVRLRIAKYKKMLERSS